MNRFGITPEAFELCLDRDCGVPRGAHVLAAVSGGADSTALLCLLLQMRTRYPLTLSCAHVEHGMRGGDSLEDLSFVRALCERVGIAFYAAHVDAPAYAASHGCGPEDACRTLRHAFLHKTAQEIGADAIALAHHAQDQAETVLLHAARGSDIRGLCAMRMRSGRLIRPLLHASPEQLRDYLTSIGQPWREDATNADARFPRNRIRRHVLPQLEAACPGACAALCRLAEAAGRDEDYFDTALEAACREMVTTPAGAAMERTALALMHPALQSRAIVRLIARAGAEPQTARTIAAVADALQESGQAQINLTQGAHALLGRRFLCIVRRDADMRGEALHVQMGGTVETETRLGRFSVRPAHEEETGDGIFSQVIPLRLLCGAEVTPPRAGDAIVPFGRHTPKKLSRMMMDAGIERGLRSAVPVLRTGRDVLWAVGLRPSQLCRAQDGDVRMMVAFRGSLRQIVDAQKKDSHIGGSGK